MSNSKEQWEHDSAQCLVITKDACISVQSKDDCSEQNFFNYWCINQLFHPNCTPLVLKYPEHKKHKSVPKVVPESFKLTFVRWLSFIFEVLK